MLVFLGLQISDLTSSPHWERSLNSGDWGRMDPFPLFSTQNPRACARCFRVPRIMENYKRNRVVESPERSLVLVLFLVLAGCQRLLLLSPQNDVTHNRAYESEDENDHEDNPPGVFLVILVLLFYRGRGVGFAGEILIGAKLARFRLATSVWVSSELALRRLAFAASIRVRSELAVLPFPDLYVVLTGLGVKSRLEIFRCWISQRQVALRARLTVPCLNSC
jgi:hypothetical protein